MLTRTKANDSPPRVRSSTRRDFEILIEHRRRMWEEIGGYSRAELRAADRPYRRWLGAEIRHRRYFGYVAEIDGVAVGSGGIWLAPAQPRPGRFTAAHLPYILSMFTEPAYRGRGVATALVVQMLRWIDRRGYRSRVYLHASRFGRPVYARLGFRDGREMILDLERGVPRQLLRRGARVGAGRRGARRSRPAGRAARPRRRAAPRRSRAGNR